MNCSKSDVKLSLISIIIILGGIFLGPTSVLAKASQPSSPILAACFPTGDRYKAWPVKAIYLHGLFSIIEDERGFIQLEKNNRQTIEQLALKLQIRIAAPIGNYSMKHSVFAWNDLTVTEMKKRSLESCSTAAAQVEANMPFILIGFSNGGYKAREIGLNCQQAVSFDIIFSIGAPKNMKQSPCPPPVRLINIKDHQMPSVAEFIKMI